MRSRFVVSVLPLVSAACATPVPEGPPLQEWEALFPEVVDPTRETDGPRGFYRARFPSEEQRRALDAATRVYIEGDDEAFAAAIQGLEDDPVASFWLGRLLVKFVIEARDAAGRVVGDDVPIGEPVWRRPMRHLRSMGRAAVAPVVLDLVRSRRSDRVELGREILVELGPEAFPAWRGVFDIDDLRARRRLMSVLGEWPDPTPEMLAVLRSGAADPDFGVRAAAFGGLAKSSESLPFVLDALARDDDPFVRRAIAEALGEHRSREVAEALLRYMERSVDEGDHRGTVAADESLRKMSGRARPGNLRTWRSWVSTLRD